MRVGLKGEEIHQIEGRLKRRICPKFDGVGRVEELAERRGVATHDAGLDPVEDAHVVERVPRPVEIIKGSRKRRGRLIGHYLLTWLPPFVAEAATNFTNGHLERFEVEGNVHDLTRSTGGIFHVPSRISCFGQYSHMTTLNVSFGAGSQFDSLSLPGESG